MGSGEKVVKAIGGRSFGDFLDLQSRINAAQFRERVRLSILTSAIQRRFPACVECVILLSPGLSPAPAASFLSLCLLFSSPLCFFGLIRGCVGFVIAWFRLTLLSGTVVSVVSRGVVSFGALGVAP